MEVITDPKRDNEDARKDSCHAKQSIFGILEANPSILQRFDLLA